MAEKTKIEWTKSTWIECRKILPGCDDSYAAEGVEIYRHEQKPARTEI